VALSNLVHLLSLAVTGEYMAEELRGKFSNPQDFWKVAWKFITTPFVSMKVRNTVWSMATLGLRDKGRLPLSPKALS
jgi:hypothetical protein